MTDAEEFALLCRKPFGLSLEAYLQLDDWQIVNVYFRPCTADAARHGYYWPMPSRGAATALRWTRLAYFREGRANGIDKRIIRRGWRAYKMVLLYGIEGDVVSHCGAMRRVMAAQGAEPGTIDEAVRARSDEIDAYAGRRPRDFSQWQTDSSESCSRSSPSQPTPSSGQSAPDAVPERHRRPAAGPPSN